MWVCLCFKLNDQDIDVLIKERGLENVISKSRKKGCGTCTNTILDLQKVRLLEGKKD